MSFNELPTRSGRGGSYPGLSQAAPADRHIGGHSGDLGAFYQTDLDATGQSSRLLEPVGTPYRPEHPAGRPIGTRPGFQTSFPTAPMHGPTGSISHMTSRSSVEHQGPRPGYGPTYGPSSAAFSASPIVGQFRQSVTAIATETYPDPGAEFSARQDQTTDGDRYPERSSCEWDSSDQTIAEWYLLDQGSSKRSPTTVYRGESGGLPRWSGGMKPSGNLSGGRRPSNRDEFDGPHQFLDQPGPETLVACDHDLPTLPTHLMVQEQDEILSEVNDCLSRCAFHFVARYQFPIPLEVDKRRVSVPSDREWTEWVYLLKRLATKRRIPTRVLYQGQIKQLITVLENSLEMRHAAKHQSRPLKDDRNVLQLISAGIQVAKILKDAIAMEQLDRLYVRTEELIQSRKVVVKPQPFFHHSFV